MSDDAESLTIAEFREQLIIAIERDKGLMLSKRWCENVLAAIDTQPAQAAQPVSMPDGLVQLSCKASPDWTLPAKGPRIAPGVVLGDAVHEYARGSGQSQIASFNVVRIDVDDIRDPAEVQAANTEFAVKCVNFVRGLIAAPQLSADVAAKLCEIYFSIAASCIGEAEVRRRRDELIDAPTIVRGE